MSTSEDPKRPSVEETLSWEAEKRPRAATVAILGGLLTLMGNVMLTLITRNSPTEAEGVISLPEALGARIEGRAPEGPSVWVGRIDYWGDQVIPLTISTVLTSVAGACLALTGLFLYRATAARTGAIGRAPVYALVTGLVLFPIGRLIREIAQWVGAANFSDDGVRTAEAARDVLAAPAVGLGGLFELFGAFGLAVGITLVSLNAMRAGLLTRFLGVLGIIVGVLTIFQADQPGIVRAFWLIAVGLLIAGRLRTIPPAWNTGRAEPWPTQQQLREQRASASGGSVSAPRPEQDRAPGETRKKRKRRG